MAEGRRGEALVLHLTGVDELALDESQEGVEIIYDQPNYGGVWGDFQGGWVVAVLDCAQVDLDEIARIGGGPKSVRVIEVPYGFEQINVFKDELVAELRASEISGSVSIDSTLTGRLIRVTLEDPSQLASDFGAGVPAQVFSIEQGPLDQAAASSLYSVPCREIIDFTDTLPDDYVELSGAVAIPLPILGMQVGRTDGDFRFSKFGMAIRAGVPAVVSVKAADGDAHLDYGSFDAARVPDISQPVSFAPCPTQGGAWVIYAGGIWTTKDGCVDVTVTSAQTTEQARLGIRVPC